MGKKKEQVDPADLMPVAMPKMSRQDNMIVERLVQFGPLILGDYFETEEEQHAFLARPEIKKELAKREQIVSEAPAIMARSAVLTKAKLLPLLPKAALILTQRLNGPTKDENGKMSPMPSEEQVAASREVLEMFNVSANDITLNVNIPLATQAGPSKEPATHYDPMAVAARQTARDAIEQIVKLVGDSESLRADALALRKKRKKMAGLRKAAKDE